MAFKLFIKITKKEPVIYLVDENHRPLNVIYSCFNKLEKEIDNLIIKQGITEIKIFKNKINFSPTFHYKEQSEQSQFYVYS